MSADVDYPAVKCMDAKEYHALVKSAQAGRYGMVSCEHKACDAILLSTGIPTVRPYRRRPSDTMHWFCGRHAQDNGFEAGAIPAEFQEPAGFWADKPLLPVAPAEPPPAKPARAASARQPAAPAEPLVVELPVVRPEEVEAMAEQEAWAEAYRRRAQPKPERPEEPAGEPEMTARKLKLYRSRETGETRTAPEWGRVLKANPAQVNTAAVRGFLCHGHHFEEVVDKQPTAPSAEAAAPGHEPARNEVAHQDVAARKTGGRAAALFVLDGTTIEKSASEWAAEIGIIPAQVRQAVTRGQMVHGKRLLATGRIRLPNGTIWGAQRPEGLRPAVAAPRTDPATAAAPESAPIAPAIPRPALPPVEGELAIDALHIDPVAGVELDELSGLCLALRRMAIPETEERAAMEAAIGWAHGCQVAARCYREVLEGRRRLVFAGGRIRHEPVIQEVT